MNIAGLFLGAVGFFPGGSTRKEGKFSHTQSGTQAGPMRMDAEIWLPGCHFSIWQNEVHMKEIKSPGL